MLSKMRACIAGAYVLAHVRRAASPLGVMRHYGRVRIRPGWCGSNCVLRGRPMAAPTRVQGRRGGDRGLWPMSDA